MATFGRFLNTSFVESWLSRPIDVEEWGQILIDLEKKIALIEKTVKRTSKMQADLEFYNTSAAHFRHFKDAWRNHVMRTRSSYDETQAKSVMVHVQEFMQHLADRLPRAKEVGTFLWLDSPWRNPKWSE